jgi:F-type H+-transporting ATPase subunit epsilon
MRITIATVAETLYEGEAKELIIPGVDGEMTILGNHMPLVTNLKAGQATVVNLDGTRQQYPVNGGVLEVSHNHATVLL